MARITVNGSEVFQIPRKNFCIGYTSAGYTLNYSADGVNWTAWEKATAQNVNQIVENAPLNMYYKLAGNSQDGIVITY